MSVASQWVCSVCGKPKALLVSSRPETVSDCWTCASKQKFIRLRQFSTQATSGNGGGSMPPNSDPSAVKNASLTAYAAWAASRLSPVMTLVPLQNRSPVQAPTDFVLDTARSSCVFARSKSCPSERSLPAEAAPKLVTPPLTFQSTPPEGRAAPAVLRGVSASNVGAHGRGPPGAQCYGAGGSPPAFKHTGDSFVDTQDKAGTSRGGSDDGQHRAVWKCVTCGSSKDLSGSHLNGKQSVRSDCWPCAQKRVFMLSTAAGSSNATIDRISSDDAPCVAPNRVPSPNDATHTPLLIEGSGSFDVHQFYKIIAVEQRKQLLRRNFGSPTSALGGIVRPCPPSSCEYPMIYAIEHEVFASAETEIGDDDSSSTTDSQNTVGSIARLAARAGMCVIHAAAQLSRDISPSPADLIVAVFCNTQDQVAAVAAYLALTQTREGDVLSSGQRLRFTVTGPPPEFTTSRTTASLILDHLGTTEGVPEIKIAAPVTHDERHWAVKHIARRSRGIVLSPGSVLSFVLAERAHAACKATETSPPPDLTLILLGAPAQWDEIPRIHQIVQTLKASTLTR